MIKLKLYFFVIVFGLFSCKKECDIISYTYDDKEVIEIDTSKAKLTKEYTFDEQNRITTRTIFSSGGRYLSYFEYDSNNRLKSIKVERHVKVGDNYCLFVINDWNFTYNGNNPIEIIKNSKIVNREIGGGSDQVITESIEYYEDVFGLSKKNLCFVNNLLMPDLIGVDFENTYLYLGEQHNKLIKSITRTYDNGNDLLETHREEYNYIKDDKGRVTKIEKISVYKGNLYRNISNTLLYNCE